MSNLFEILLKLDIDAHVALDLDEYVEDGGTLELYRPNSEERQILDTLRPVYSVAFYKNFVEIKKSY